MPIFKQGHGVYMKICEKCKEPFHKFPKSRVRTCPICSDKSKRRLSKKHGGN